MIGSTFILVMERYAAELRSNGGRLMLSGVHQNVLDQLLRTETTESVPEDAIYEATDILGESTKIAMVTAQAWLDAKESTPDEVVPSADQEEEEA